MILTGNALETFIKQNPIPTASGFVLMVKEPVKISLLNERH
jgi:hypothetical protein